MQAPADILQNNAEGYRNMLQPALVNLAELGHLETQDAIGTSLTAGTYEAHELASNMSSFAGLRSLEGLQKGIFKFGCCRANTPSVQ